MTDRVPQVSMATTVHLSVFAMTMAIAIIRQESAPALLVTKAISVRMNVQVVSLVSSVCMSVNV